MIRRTLALLLTIVLAFGMTNTLAFANEAESGATGTPAVTETAAFTGGYAVSPTVAIPAEIHVNDTITFYLNTSNFQNPKDYDLAKLSAVITGASAASFEKQTFWRDAATGTVYFSIKAKSEADYQAFTVYVTNSVLSTLPHSFSTAVTAVPESSAPSSSAPESSEPSSSSSTPESSAPPSSSSTPESSAPSSSSSAPESSEPSSSSSAPESSEPSSSSSAPESSEESSSSSASESSEESSSSSTPESSEPPASSEADDEDDGGGFLGGLLGGLKGLFSPPPTTIGHEITAASSSGSSWTYMSGIPNTNSPSTVAVGTKVVFSIPDDNFATGGGTTKDPAANVTEMNQNSTLKDSIVVSNGMDAYFTPVFNTTGSGASQSFVVEMTVTGVSGGITVPKGTTISFGNKVRYTFNADLNLVQTIATGSGKAIGITAGSELGGKNTWVSRNGSYYSGGINVIDNAQEGDEYLIHFYPQFFEWDKGNTPAKVTLSGIRSKISLRQSNTSGSRVFEVVELASVKGEAVVRVKIKDVFPTLKEVDFRTTLYLTVGGKRDTDSACEIEGTIGSDDPLEFYSEEEYIDISGGIIGQAVESIRKAHVYIGEDVTVNVPYIRKNAKFYGAAVTNEITNRDQSILEDYPDIDVVYTLHTLGLNGAGVTVTIDLYGGYHVYDGDLNYLGRATKDLPYSDKYYLSVKELDIEVDDGWDDGDGDDFWDDPPLSGDDLIPPANDNWNPATGNKA